MTESTAAIVRDPLWPEFMTDRDPASVWVIVQRR
jgi:hypothetical protein